MFATFALAADPVHGFTAIVTVMPLLSGTPLVPPLAELLLPTLLHAVTSTASAVTSTASDVSRQTLI